MDIEIDGDAVRADGYVVARLTNDIPATIQDRFKSAIETIPDEDDMIFPAEKAEDVDEALGDFEDALDKALEGVAESAEEFAKAMREALRDLSEAVQADFR